MSCIFCRIISGEIPSKLMYQDDVCVAFLDIAPVNLGHMLIVPKVHYENIVDTPDDIVAHLMGVLKKVATTALAVTGTTGFNIGVNTGEVAGQAVMHTHLHMIPRFADDGLYHWPKREIAQAETEHIATEIQKRLS